LREGSNRNGGENVTYDDIVAMIEETGIPSAYDHYAEGESPNPPYILFLLPSSDNFFADNSVYQQYEELAIELYTDTKQPPIERRIENVLIRHELSWNKTETWIDSEKLYEVRYSVVIDYDATPDEE